MTPVAAVDEQRHPPGRQNGWAEWWYFDFAAADGSLAGFVRVTLFPHRGAAWYWAALVGRGRRLVLLKDHDLDAPRGRDLEFRGQGIWSAVTCETPLDHWSVGLEAFAVAYDDPTEAWRSERGDLIGLGYDLEWEATAAASWIDGGYRQPCRVSGQILVGDEQFDFDGPGGRAHQWGMPEWGTDPSAPLLAAAPLLLDDGTRVMRALVPRPEGPGWAEWIER